MASLVIATGVETHPEISIDGMDFRNGLVNFRWSSGPYTGDCSEVFVLSVEDHGAMTVSDVIAAISAEMLSKITA